MPDQNNFRSNQTTQYPNNRTQQPGTGAPQQNTTQSRMQASPGPGPSNPPRTVTAAPPNPPPVTNEPAPSTVTSPYYLAGYLQQFIGRFVRVEFSLGTAGALNDRVGILHDVGASYITIREFPSNNLEIGDLYSVKFVTVYDNQPPMV